MPIKELIIYVIAGSIIFQDTLKAILGLTIIDYFDELIVLSLFVYSILLILKRKKINKLSIKLLILLVIFSGIGLLSAYINSNGISKYVILANFLSIKSFLFLFSLLNINFKTITIKRYINAAIFYSKVCMFFATIQFFIPKIYAQIFTFVFESYRFGFPSITSLFRHPGTYGWFMLCIALYYYAEYIMKNNKIYLKNFISTVICALLSLRVKVILSLVVIIAITIFVNGKRKINLKKIIISISVIAVILFGSRNILLNAYSLYFTQDNGISARQALTTTSFNIMKDYFPIGVGFGKYGSWYARQNYSEYYYKYEISHVFGMSPDNPAFATDTYWPSIIGETGLIGTSIYIYIILFIYITISKNIKVYKNNLIFFWGKLVLIQTLLESSSEQIFNNSPQYIVIIIILAWALSYKEVVIDEKNSILLT